MATPDDNVKTTDHLALLFLVTAIGKSLVGRGLLQTEDIVEELEHLRKSISNSDKLLKLEIENTIRKVSDWDAT